MISLSLETILRHKTSLHKTIYPCKFKIVNWNNLIVTTTNQQYIIIPSWKRIRTDLIPFLSFPMKLEFSLCENVVKIHRGLVKRSWNFVNEHVFFLSCSYCPLFEIPTPKNGMHKVKIKFIQWLWRSRKCFF